jgi:hypothetical protein
LAVSGSQDFDRGGFNAQLPEQFLREPRRSDHLRRRRLADFLPPEKKDVTLPAKKNRLTKQTAVNVARIVDNDWRRLPILDANVCPFDSASIWALSTPACSPCNKFSAALLHIEYLFVANLTDGSFVLSRVAGTAHRDGWIRVSPAG